MRRRFGQNFLVDKNIARKIVNGLDVNRKDTIIEIGPGRGILTRLIAERAGKVIAVEIDERLHEFVSDELRRYGNIEFIRKDFLDYDFSGLGSVKIVGNLPYYIVSKILFYLTEFKNWETGVFMVQKEVGERIISPPGRKEYSPFSIAMQYHFNISIIHRVSRNVFFPRPKVDSMVLHFLRHRSPPVLVYDEKSFFRFVRASFQKRRKKLIHTLREFLNAQALKDFKEAHFLDARPEELSMDDFAHIVRGFKT